MPLQFIMCFGQVKCNYLQNLEQNYSLCCKTCLKNQFCQDQNGAADRIRWDAVYYVDNDCFTGISDFSFSVGLLYDLLFLKSLKPFGENCLLA